MIIEPQTGKKKELSGSQEKQFVAGKKRVAQKKDGCDPCKKRLEEQMGDRNLLQSTKTHRILVEVQRTVPDITSKKAKKGVSINQGT